MRYKKHSLRATKDPMRKSSNDKLDPKKSIF